MKKITNKIIFIIITCASIISVSSLTKTNAQEINRNDLTAYKTDMSSIENETNIRTASSSEETTWDVSENGDGSVIATIEGIQGGMYVHMKISGTGRITDFYNNMQKDCSLIVISVRIESGITGIGDNAFSGCSFRDISIPNSVTSIGDNAFLNCSSELTITTPCNNEYVINYAKTNNIQTNISHTYKFDSVDTDNKIVTYKCENCEETKTETFTESWDVSENQNNSVIAVLTTDGTLIISGTGRMKDYDSDTYLPYYNKKESIKKVIIEEGVESIGENAFGTCSSLTNITIPSSVTAIGACAFQKCSSLISIIIPKGVTDIKIATFNGCDSLISVTIPESVTNIQRLAFGNCNNLSNITIPKSVTNIEDFAFINCDQLQNMEVDNNNLNYCSDEGVLFNKEKTRLMVYPEKKEDKEYIVPSSVTKISDSAFQGCSGLTNITIPGSVTSIGDSTFIYCSNLTSVILEKGITDIQNHAFSYCDKLNNITIPNSVTSIGENAFYNHSSELTINTPCNSEYVIYYANANNIQANISHIYKLDSINYENKTITYKCTTCQTMETKSFADAENVWDVSANGDWSVIAMLTTDGTLTIGGTGNMKNYTSSAMVPYYNNKENIKSAIIEEGVTSIGDYAFFTYRNLTSVTIPSSVRSIEKVPFYECGSLTSIVVDNDNQNYCSENGVLFNKEKTELIKYPQGKKNTEYMIPTSVTSISSQAFHQCDALTKVEIPNSVTNIGNETFARCSNLISITIPNSVTSIGEYLFYKCSNLTNVIIGATSIKDKYIFDGCDSLASVTISSSVTSINSEVFWYPAGLMNITVDKDNQNYCSENGVLFNKEKTELIRYPAGKTAEYTIPNSVINIVNEAFSSCSKLTSIIIPNSVTSIGDKAFDGCSSLKNVIMEEGITSIKDYLFIDCDSLKNIIIPSSVTSIGVDVFYDPQELTITTPCNSEYVISYADENDITKEIIHKKVTGYEWNSDKSECVANITCEICKDYFETETVQTTSEITTEATCEEAGERTYTATFTNEAFTEQTTTEEIPALGHTAGQAVEENRVEATCTQEGHYDEVIYCTVCNKEISRKTKTIAKKAHTEVIDEAVEPTCTEKGKTEGKHCSVCGEILVAQKEIPALGHDWKEATYTWNEDKTECTAERVCTRDASHKETETVKTTNSVTKAATCEEIGERTYTATFTNEAFAQQTTTEEIKATGHKAGQAVEENRVESTCTEEGHYDEVIYCTVCNKEISRERKTIKAKGHTYSTEWTIDKEATCEETGEKSHHCAECGERADITTIEALGHDYQIKSTTEAVCEKGGTIIYECTRCKATKQETIPATGHRKEIDAAVEPTCTEKGKTEGKHCSVCGKVLVAQEEIPAKGHTAGQPIEENRVESTCTQEGHYDEVIYCTECNTEISRVQKTIEKKEHTYSTEWTIDKEATCEETGEKSHHCTECGERTDITTIEALGHDYQIKSTTEAVCEKGGTIIYECTRCKTTKEETTPALGHKGGTPVEENRVEATCTENGSYDEVTYCKVCGEKLLKEKKIIPALGHDYEKIVVQPTETEQGYTLHICKRCKDEYKDNYVPSIDKKDPIQIKDDEKDITIIEKEEQKYIIVEPNTTVDRLKEAIIIEKEYTVIDKENKQKEGILATGDKITVKDTYKTTYIIIVKGDVNEDGVIDFMGDVVMLNNYRLGLIKLSKEAILAGDINMDGKIDFVEDVVKINNYRISAVRSLIK